MTRLNVEGAKASRTQLLKYGEQIVIARNRRPVVDLIQASRARAAFQGSMKGQIDMSRFDEADEEIAREFGMLD
jgi:antitoxin (DNA-binding transcriptional repressor) of toxin-antitoxin stability system